MKFTIQIVSLPPESEPDSSEMLMELTSVPGTHLPQIGDFISLFDFDGNDNRLWVVVSRLFRYFSDTACCIELVVDSVPS